ncbi:hypothetical protein [Legionella erythra]|uniref:Coiled-coil-containing protein n=1 Tax=Legionella erythra TaxID=448 RepID=A0A0W0TQY0_LEGER|nr:hypothetical protein [Legionella erythra]KTC97952.1 coiled-coil-containing protein [Legionella erythra]
MPKNILFNFLSFRKKRNKRDLEHAESITLKQTLDKKNYFLIELPRSNYSLMGLGTRFNLVKHHVSIYENESRANPHLSQLHYTADFINTNRIEYRLHVYYDHKDQMVSGPHFSVRLDNNKYREIDASSVSQELLELAEKSMRAVIVEIREKYLDTYSQLEQEYQRLDRQCSILYETRESHMAEYVAKMKNFIKLAENLSILTSHNHYTHKHAFLTRLLITIQTPAMSTEAPVDTSTTEPQSSLSLNTQREDTSRRDAARVRNKSSNTSRRQTNNPLQGIERQVDALARQFIALSAQPREKNVMKHTKELGNLWALCNQYSLEADLVIPQDAPQSSIPCLTKLQTLSVKLEKACKEHFLYLLEQKQFDAAKLLQNFYYLLDVNRLAAALKDDNAELLDFILTYGEDLVLDNQVLIIDKKKYTNAVVFCYEQGLADCLAVLINHDASILIPGANGLPLAYSLLMQDEHPLQRVLAACPQKTTLSSSFYFGLKNALRRYIASEELPANEQKKISAAIAYYQILANDLLFNRDLGPLGQQVNYSISAITLLMNEPLPADLMQDEAIQQAYSQCIHCAMQFFKPLKPRARMDMVKHFHGNLNDLSELFRLNDLSDAELADKVEFLKQYLHDVEIMWDDLADCMRNLKKNNSLHIQQEAQDSVAEAVTNLFSRYNLDKASSDEEETLSEDDDLSPLGALMSLAALAYPSVRTRMGFFSGASAANSSGAPGEEPEASPGI